MTSKTVHGSAIVLGRHGVLIEGQSGSGKSTLAAALVDAWVARGKHACWVCDDQLKIAHHSSSVVAHTVSTIAGKAEKPFFGIVEVVYADTARIDLIVSLVAQEELERMPEDTPHSTFSTLPVLRLPRTQAALNVPLVAARLEQIA